MTTTTSVVWGLAGALDVVPSPPDDRTRHVLSSWWERPRSFGCPHVQRSAVWVVVAPQPEVLCGECSVWRVLEERRCWHCHQPCDELTDHLRVYEMAGGSVVVFGWSHAEECR